jgi:REP element-mobilizing transposase RayT
MTRGNRRQGIFLDEKDLQRFLSYLSGCKKRFSFRLYAYALMKNHLHLLIEVERVPLSRIMQTLLFGYAGYFNRRYGEVGHLFQGRYRAILCEKDAYLLELIRYIHLNPVRAKIVNRPEDYAWTSHLSYLGKRREALIDEGFVLEQLSDNGSLARRRYRQFVWEGISTGHEAKYYQVKDQLYLGGESFIERIEIEKKEVEPWAYEISLEAISHEVARAMGITEGKISSATKDRQGVRGRSVAAYLARKTAGYTVKEIADYFKRGAVTIGEGIMQIEEHTREDKTFEKALKDMENNITKGRKRKYRVSVA